MDLFKALANPRRRRIIELIALWGKITPGELQTQTKINGPTLTRHLDKLKAAGLVRIATSSNRRIYTIEWDSLHEISGWVGSVVNASRTRGVLGNGGISERDNPGLESRTSA